MMEDQRRDITGWNSAYQQQPYQETQPHPETARAQKVFKANDVRQILDLGCGDGRHLVHFGRLGYQMTGLDSAIEGLKRSRDWLEREGLSARLVCADMRYIPLPAGSFNAIIAIQVIHHMHLNGIVETLHSIYRVLGDGGIIFGTVPRYPPDGWQRRFQEIEHHTYVPTEGFERGIPHHFFTEKELYEVMSDFEGLDIWEDLHTGRHFVMIARK